MRHKLLLILFFLLSKTLVPIEALIPDETALKKLYEKTERAYLAEKWGAAKKGYELLIEGVDVKRVGHFTKFPLDWHTYIDLCTRLMYVYQKLGHYELCDPLYQLLEKKDPPLEVLTQIAPLYAKSLLFRQQGEKAFKYLSAYEKHVSLAKWQKEDASFYKGLAYVQKRTFDTLLHKGAQHKVQGRFAPALATFEKAYKGVQEGIYPQPPETLCQELLFQIAETHFYLGNAETTLKLLFAKRAKEHYLKGHAFLTLKEEKEALAHFEKSVEKNTCPPLLALKMGELLANQSELQRAKAHLTPLTQLNGTTSLKAALQVALIHLKENHPKKALEILNPLPEDHEVRAMKGWAFFLQQKYLPAAPYFENEPYNQALCYLYAKDLLALERAEQLLTPLKNEEALLALGEVFVTKATLDPTFEAKAPLFALLEKALPTFSLEGQARGYWLLAKGCSDPTLKEHFYKLATSDAYKPTRAWSLALIAHGFDHLFAAKKEENHPHLLDKALHAFNRALEKKGTQQEPLAKKGLAYALYYRNTKGTLRTCLSLLESLPEEHLDEDLLFLKGMAYAKRACLEKKYDLTPLVQATFAQLPPKSAYREKTLFTLAKLFEKQDPLESKKRYIDVANTYPLSPLAPKALYKAATLSEQLGEKSALLWRRLYAAYPASPLAEEAYLSTYSQEAYLKGDEEALKHLEAFATFAPHSPYLIASTYFLALAHKKKEPDKAIALLQQGIAHFTPNLAPSLALFYLHALADIALLHQEKGAYDQAHASLVKLLLHFQSTTNALTEPLFTNTPFPSLYQRALYTQATTFLKEEKLEKGREVLAELLVLFAKHRITEGNLLAKTWIEEGKVALTLKDYLLAKKCFAFAETAGQNALTVKEKLALWMAQSDTHRQLQEYGEAMLKLSLIINEDAVSPLRIQAMMQRAEIYALQGRHQLAIRQLKAVEKKGGALGKQAKEKLKNAYFIS